MPIPIKEDLRMEPYEAMEMEVMEFEGEDVITGSGDMGDLPGQEWPYGGGTNP